MSAWRFLLRVHLWAGVLLGVQLFLWMLSGVVMTWFDLDLVRGERGAFTPAPIELETTSYASPGGVIAQSNGATRLELRTFLGRPVYEVEDVDGEALFDARSGARISPITEEQARNVAEDDFVGDAEIMSIALLDDPPQEYRGAAPVWRADFDDRLRTRLYVSPATGEIAARRNAVWRLYDFFWMLHIMDYGERKNFNNPLVKTASAAGLVFAVSGLALVVMRNGRRKIVRDVRRLAPGQKRKAASDD
ncbi:MAG: PepSY domain-containing protein [Pseudomonadota bacterium]